MNYRFTAQGHHVSFQTVLLPFPECDLPEESAAAFLGTLSRFPMARLSCADTRADNATVQLWHDAAKNVFFAASIDHILDLHAARLDAERRDRQRKQQTADRYKRARLSEHGAAYDSRHRAFVAGHVASVTQRLRAVA